MQFGPSLRVSAAVILLFLAFCLGLSAQDGTLAGQLQTQAIASDLQGTTAPANSSAAPATNAPPAQVPAPPSFLNAQEKTPAAAPATTPAQAAPASEVEKAYGYRDSREGPVLQALRHMSEYRFFYSAGLVLFTLLVLLSTSNTAARRIFGTFCVVGILFLLHYLFIGVTLPPLRPDDWKGPLQRDIGMRSVKEWQRVPDIGTSLFFICEKNFLGPKNETSMSEFFSQVMSAQTGGKEANVEYAKEFVTHGIRWQPATVTLSKSETRYFWAAEFKQQRIVIELSNAPFSLDAEKDLQEIVTLVGNIK